MVNTDGLRKALAFRGRDSARVATFEREVRAYLEAVDAAEAERTELLTEVAGYEPGEYTPDVYDKATPTRWYFTVQPDPEAWRSASEEERARWVNEANDALSDLGYVVNVRVQ